MSASVPVAARIRPSGEDATPVSRSAGADHPAKLGARREAPQAHGPAGMPAGPDWRAGQAGTGDR